MKDEARPTKRLRYPRPGEQDPPEFSPEQVEAAADWLKFVLKDGPLEAGAVYQLAEECSIWRALLQLAKRHVGVVHSNLNARLPNARAAWVWTLPQKSGRAADPWDDD
jgi:hypothetical protein